MTSKEALEYIARNKGINIITNAVEYNWRLYPVLFNIINKDLDKLEELEQKEKPMKVIKGKTIYKYDEGDCVKSFELSECICPYCHEKLLVSEMEEINVPQCHYCYYCGQKLDWNLDKDNGGKTNENL